MGIILSTDSVGTGYSDTLSLGTPSSPSFSNFAGTGNSFTSITLSEPVSVFADDLYGTRMNSFAADALSSSFTGYNDVLSDPLYLTMSPLGSTNDLFNTVLGFNDTLTNPSLLTDIDWQSMPVSSDFSSFDMLSNPYSLSNMGITIDLPPMMTPEEWERDMERRYGEPSAWERITGGIADGIDSAYSAVGDATIWVVQNTLGDGAVNAIAADDTYFASVADRGNQMLEGDVVGGYLGAAGDFYSGPVVTASEAVGEASVVVIHEVFGDEAINAMAADDTYFARYADAGDKLAEGQVFEAYKDTAMTTYFGAVDGTAWVIGNTVDEEWLATNTVVASLGDAGNAIEADMRRFDADTWGYDSFLGRRLNHGADAGNVYWDKGAGTYIEIYAWEGIVKNGVGQTIEGFSNLPTIATELTGTGLNMLDGGERNWRLYEHSFGEDVADALWYNKSGIGGRFVPEDENQAALLGYGSVIGDAATIPAGGAFGKLGLIGRSRVVAPLSTFWTTLDVAQTSAMALPTISSSMSDYYEARIPGIHPEDFYDRALHGFGVEAIAGQTIEDKHNLYVRHLTDQLIKAGENEEAVSAMDWQARETLYGEYASIQGDVGMALARNSNITTSPDAAVASDTPATGSEDHDIPPVAGRIGPQERVAATPPRELTNNFNSQTALMRASLTNIANGAFREVNDTDLDRMFDATQVAVNGGQANSVPQEKMGFFEFLGYAFGSRKFEGSLKDQFNAYANLANYMQEHKFIAGAVSFVAGMLPFFNKLPDVADIQRTALGHLRIHVPEILATLPNDDALAAVDRENDGIHTDVDVNEAFAQARAETPVEEPDVLEDEPEDVIAQIGPELHIKTPAA